MRHGRTEQAISIKWAVGVILCLTTMLASPEAGARPGGRHHPDMVAGVVSVIDGDTLDMNGQRIRLFGIDAPESGQRCRDARGGLFRCGAQAANALSAWINRNPVACEVRGKDRYGRLLGVCSVRGESMQVWLVANGHALAYRTYSLDYVAIEDRARLSRSGLWAGEFVAPWAWRRGERLSGEKGAR